MRYLMLIDIQNGFITPETKHILPDLKELTESFDGMLIATQFINRGEPFSSILGWNELQNKPAIDLIPFVQTRADIVIRKDRYTACTKGLIEFIRQSNISEIYIAGIDTDCCVMKTALDLFEIGIKPIVLSHYCASTAGNNIHLAALDMLKRNIGEAQVVDGKFENIFKA